MLIYEMTTETGFTYIHTYLHQSIVMKKFQL